MQTVPSSTRRLGQARSPPHLPRSATQEPSHGQRHRRRAGHLAVSVAGWLCAAFALPSLVASLTSSSSVEVAATRAPALRLRGSAPLSKAARTGQPCMHTCVALVRQRARSAAPLTGVCLDAARGGTGRACASARSLHDPSLPRIGFLSCRWLGSTSRARRNNSQVPLGLCGAAPPARRGEGRRYLLMPGTYAGPCLLPLEATQNSPQAPQSPKLTRFDPVMLGCMTSAHTSSCRFVAAHLCHACSSWAWPPRQPAACTPSMHPGQLRC
jgi:hypothetical protein